jgi:hypothetical protein
MPRGSSFIMAEALTSVRGPGSIPGCRETGLPVLDSPGLQMDQAARLVVFRAQVTNVRSLQTAMREVHRSINAALRLRHEPTVRAFTKVYALLFCAWAEAIFSKVLHTPYGLDLDEIAQVQAAKDKGVREAWKTCVRLGLRHLDAQRSNFTPNAQQKLETTIDVHVYDPSVLRNKLAHGQWEIALNRDNDAVQEEYTTKLEELDVVKISAWIEGHKLLARAVENLIESPKKAFMRDWYHFVVSIEDQIITAERRTLKEHVAKLAVKRKRQLD